MASLLPDSTTATSGRFSSLAAFAVLLVGGGLIGAVSGCQGDNNIPPIVDAGSRQTVNENTIVQLSGRGSDPDGGAVTYAWTQFSGPAVTLSPLNDPHPTFKAPQVAIDSVETVVLALTVTDSHGAFATDIVEVAVESTDYLLFLSRSATYRNWSRINRYDTRSGQVTFLSDAEAYAGWQVSPDGEYIAYNQFTLVEVSPREEYWRSNLYIAKADGSSRVEIEPPVPVPLGVGRGLRGYAWSPDGQQLAYIEILETPSSYDDTLVYVVNRDGTNQRRLDSDEQITGMVRGTCAGVSYTSIGDDDWSVDGRYISVGIFATWSCELYNAIGANIIDVSLGEPNSLRVTPLLPADERVRSASRRGWSPTESRIAYQFSQDSETTEFYTAMPDGSEDTRISTPIQPGGEERDYRWVRLSWSPDGSRIAFVNDQEIADEFELFTTKPDGTNLVKISDGFTNSNTTGGRPLFEWSPDGSRLVYARRSSIDVMELISVKGDGTESRTLAAVDGAISNYEWSPDSSLVAYTITVEVIDEAGDWYFMRSLSIATADGTETVGASLPALRGGVSSSSVLWSPDGSRIAFLGLDELGDFHDLYTVRSDGSGLIKVSAATSGQGWHGLGGWSSDSSRLAYVLTSPDHKQYDLYISDPDGARSTKILEGQTSFPRHEWSP